MQITGMPIIKWGDWLNELIFAIGLERLFVDYCVANAAAGKITPRDVEARAAFLAGQGALPIMAAPITLMHVARSGLSYSLIQFAPPSPSAAVAHSQKNGRPKLLIAKA